MENFRGAKISAENLKGINNFHTFPENARTGYTSLKKTPASNIPLTMPETWNNQKFHPG